MGLFNPHLKEQGYTRTPPTNKRFPTNNHYYRA